MSDMQFSCPGCNQVLEAPVDMVGETVECPACGESMVVPEPPREEISLDDISIGGTSPAATDAAAEETKAPAVSAADIVAQAADDDGGPTDDAAPCPACGADMEPDSVLCMSCGYHKTLGKKISTEIE